jgi:hypothetical protein
MVAGRWQLRHFIAVVLQSGLDGFQFGFCLLASAFVFLFSSSSGGRFSNSTTSPSRDRWWQGIRELHLSKK